MINILNLHVNIFPICGKLHPWVFYHYDADPFGYEVKKSKKIPFTYGNRLGLKPLYN
jgi:hypothetical protein